VYGLKDTGLVLLNTIFIALVIFYVYPLRFLTMFLTNFFFMTDIEVKIEGTQVPYLMIYYGFVAFALYFVLYLFYHRALRLTKDLQLNAYEEFYTKAQKRRLLLMFAIPLLSICSTLIINQFSFVWASFVGGIVYVLYTPLIIAWHHQFKKQSKAFAMP